MRNILVGFDGSRGADTALRQALPIADALGARVSLLQAVEPLDVVENPAGSEAFDPMAVVDRLEQMSIDPENRPPRAEDDAGAIAARLCEDAGVTYRWRSQHGMATRVLSEQSVAMDLIVVGRHGAAGRYPIGRTASQLIFHPTAPTVVCQEAPVALRRVMLGYEPTTGGGRALRVAAALCSALNISLDVLVADPDRRRGRITQEYASQTLRAYHVEGEQMRHEGPLHEGLRAAALELAEPLIIIGNGHRCCLPWVRSRTIQAALNVPGAMTLVVP